ncbi:prolyl oligopeptidase family serine peptidase [Blastopirellula marina]|uniref:S9 family peptidase n=1 Tax=Blastopirellula marina TaxID=124 RepID=A0A2S8GL11_9BACT|nr:prolyl oligopeptidase family serine peptidase [Blastopirellula marina]PQO45080.1 S9 family peptidase [Blastopirellula marina]
MMVRIAAGVAATWMLILSAPLCLAADGTEGKKAESVSSETDPYVWLEEVEGEKALDWVRARNKISQSKLESDADFTTLRDDLLAIFDSNERIPFVRKRGDFYYNFWRDEKNERGVWRRTTLDEYKKAEPKWEVIIDLDELAKAENENWVWSGAQMLRPDYNRVLISLSRGGADADVTREFDMMTRKFVEDGFNRPEAKGGMSWIDIDHVFVSTDFGPGSMTDSGYPRVVKLWTRGEKMEDAKTVYEGEKTDMSISGSHDDTPGYERNFIRRAIAFYNNEVYLLKEDGSLAQIEAPNSAGKGVHCQYLTLELRDAWTVGDKTYTAGSLLVANFDDFMAGKREFTVLFEPNERNALAGYSFTKDYLLLNVLEDVASKLFVMQEGADGKWSKTPLVGAPALGTVSVSPVDSDESNDYFMTSTDYLTPTTLYMGEVGKEPEELKAMPEFFDAAGLTVAQHFATSKDGTKIPYFMLYRKDMKFDGSNPTLLYGYGGFEISLQPGYRATVGRAWSTQGGVYVVANIRGGGEYGPRWHQAALKKNRLKAYEDFAAVANDLIDRKVTSHDHLGIQGGSNGGLLVGNMVTLYPDLFKAAVCQVPLLDMKRYSHLLAGASWMAEYGNPDIPEEWEFIQTYSPYHNVKEEVDYPTVLFTTSTRDDRVHPGHARKMFAKMEGWGKDVLYYENIEGGHGGAANNRQSAFMTALAFTFLKQELFPKTEE